MKNLLDLSYQEAKQVFLSAGQNEYRADQLFDWIYKKRVRDLSKMSNLAIDVRQWLAKEFYIKHPVIKERIVSDRDGTIKYLLELEDQNTIEAVLMCYEHGYSLCISSQVGCRMGCTFCASAKAGFLRNLTLGEFTAQIMIIEKEENIRISNVTVMGIGEPLDNFDNLIAFLRIATDKKGLGISARNITISTSGIVERIYELAKTGIKINLALSLHTADDYKRQEIMPAAKKYSIKESIKAMDYYFQITKRRPTYEYTLIKDFNDSRKDAEALSKLLKGKNVLVNIIFLNKTDEGKYIEPDRKAASQLINVLNKNGIEVTIRRRLGIDIDAACGQLRRNRSIKC